MKRGLLYLLIIALVLFLGVYFYILRQPSMGLPDFNYPADKITQIYFVDKNGASIKLNKTEKGVWIVEDKYEANEEMMERLLDNIQNQKAIGKVPKKRRADIKKSLEEHYTRVKVYNKDELVLEYYIGRPDDPNRGNYMSVPPLREIYDVQQEENPHNMLFDYNTNLNNWRSIWLIDVKPDDIKQVSVEYVDTPAHSFTLVNNAPHYTVTGNPPIEGELNVPRVVGYLSFFTKMSSIMIAHENTDRKKLLAPEHKYATLKLTERNGTVKVYEVYFHQITESSRNYLEGGPGKYDNELYYVLTPADDELYVVSIDNFGKLLRFYPEFYATTSDAKTD